MHLYELSIRIHVAFSQVRALLSSVLGVGLSQVVKQREFWDSIGEECQKAAGLTVRWGESGYRTYVEWAQQHEMSDREFLRIAGELAGRCGADVAIGDFIDAPDGAMDLFLVATPDGMLRRASATSNADVFEVEFYGPEEPIAVALGKLSDASTMNGPDIGADL
jgi:hypothetical protein